MNEVKQNNLHMNISHITTYQAGVAQSSAYRNLNKLFTDMLAGYGMTSMQWFIIGTVLDSGKKGIKMTVLAEQLQTGLPFITNTINLLESKGMVKRTTSIDDTRVKYVSIEPAFARKCQKIEAELRAKMRKSIYGDITREELEVYITVLYKLGAIQIRE
jgi:DNA-binding MarR family transcriptional regulator